MAYPLCGTALLAYRNNKKQHAMNPVAFVAFLMGINTTAPAPKPALNNEQPGVASAQAVKQPAAKVPGTLKRGGWDRN